MPTSSQASQAHAAEGARIAMLLGWRASWCKPAGQRGRWLAALMSGQRRADAVAAGGGPGGCCVAFRVAERLAPVPRLPAEDVHLGRGSR